MMVDRECNRKQAEAAGSEPRLCGVSLESVACLRFDTEASLYAWGLFGVDREASLYAGKYMKQASALGSDPRLLGCRKRVCKPCRPCAGMCWHVGVLENARCAESFCRS